MVNKEPLRGRRVRILTQLLRYPGWKVEDVYWETSDGERLDLGPASLAPADARLILCPKRHGAPRCSQCHARCFRLHDNHRGKRRWQELPAFGTPVFLEYSPERWKCPSCYGAPVEALAWADAHQHETRRFQQHVAFDAFSMPLSHVSAKYELAWATVARIEAAAILRWNLTRAAVPLIEMGVDEKYLGRRGTHEAKYVTIVSNLETGEPIWYGYGRAMATLQLFLATLRPAEKAQLKLAAMDMHAPFAAAIRSDLLLAHVAIVHDPFHVLKRAGETVSEVRRVAFFRAGDDLRAIGKGTRWLVLRAWENTNDDQKDKLRNLFRLNAKLASAYQVKEELREVLQAPSGAAMRQGLQHILRRTAQRANKPMRALHDSLVAHREAIVALGEHRPSVGKIEALNNNWETLVRQGRGYRNLEHLFHKLRFVTANPLRTEAGARRFLALGMPVPGGN